MTAIGVKGQYLVDLGFQDGGQFAALKESDLVSLVTHQRAGGRLPVFALTFTTGDDSVVQRLNEGSAISIREGIDDKNSVVAEWLPIKPTIQKTSQNEMRISCEGVLNVPDYTQTGRAKLWGAADAIKVARNVLGQHFEIHPDSITSSDDLMNYAQPNITDQMFVRNLTRHAWIRQGAGWNTMAITTEGSAGGKSRVRLFDMDQQISTKKGAPLFHFTNAEEGFLKTRAKAAAGQAKTPSSNPLQTAGSNSGIPVNFNEDWIATGDSGIMNAIYGYDRTNLDYNLESTGVDTQKPILGKSRLTSNPNFIRSAGKAQGIIAAGRHGYIGDNTHRQYMLAMHTNMANRALFSSFSLSIPFRDAFYPIWPLDIIQLDIPASKDQTQLNQGLSGAYIVSAVNRSYENKGLMTTITVCREGPDAAQGAFQGGSAPQQALPKPTTATA